MYVGIIRSKGKSCGNFASRNCPASFLELNLTHNIFIQAFEDRVHLFLEEFWDAGDSEWELVNAIALKGGYKCCEETEFWRQWDLPEPAVAI